MGTREDDFVERLFVASTHHTFLFFSNLGKVYWCKCYDIPQASRLSLGKAVVNLLNMEEQERLTTVLAVPEFAPGKYVLMATEGLNPAAVGQVRLARAVDSAAPLDRDIALALGEQEAPALAIILLLRAVFTACSERS